MASVAGGQARQQPRQEHRVEATHWPPCVQCAVGVLIPLGDYGPEGASVQYKGWVCTNARCGFGIRADKGKFHYERKVLFANDDAC